MHTTQLVLFTCVLATLHVPASATTIVPAEFSEMVAGSHAIVHGVVTDVRSRDAGGPRSIESLVTLTVVDRLKGEVGATVVFRVPNGQVGRYRRITVGAPEFVRGDEVVLFLRGRGPAAPMPFGLNQGVYRVRRGGGAATVLPLVPPAAGRIVRGDPARRPVTIEAFARAVRAAAERP